MDESYDKPQALGRVLQCEAREPSITERLAERKARVQAELARIEEAERLLQSQPGVTEVLNALAKLGVR